MKCPDWGTKDFYKIFTPIQRDILYCVVDFDSCVCPVIEYLTDPSTLDELASESDFYHLINFAQLPSLRINHPPKPYFS